MRAHDIVKKLLEAGPDDVSPASYLKQLPKPYEGALQYVQKELAKRLPETKGWGYSAYEAYAQIIQAAIKQFGKPANYAELFSAGIQQILQMYPDSNNMIAEEARDLFGESLIGANIETSSMGSYPGGVARVLQINPAPPDIVLQVYNEAFKDPAKEEDGEIGIFDYEAVTLI